MDNKIFIDGKEVGILPESNEVIFENSDLINEQEPYLIKNYHDPNDIGKIYLTDHKEKRTDEQRLKEYGIDSLDKLLEECILISQKQSKLPRSIRDIIVRISVEAFKELNTKAEEIKKESHKLTSLEEAKDQIIGEIGTQRRDNYEKELK